MFTAGSRYEQVPTIIFIDASGREIPYKALRLIPDPQLIQRVHRVMVGDRLDLLAHRYFGDPLQFWRICDANRAVRPDDLVAAPARRLRIPVAQR